MITRIVKMVFRPEETESFKALFNERKSLIRHFEGCTHLELWQDSLHPNTFFTGRIWESEEQLNAYRNSPFLEQTWKLTKQKFSAQPQAWSVHTVQEV